MHETFHKNVGTDGLNKEDIHNVQGCAPMGLQEPLT